MLVRYVAHVSAFLRLSLARWAVVARRRIPAATSRALPSSTAKVLSRTQSCAAWSPSAKKHHAATLGGSGRRLETELDGLGPRGTHYLVTRGPTRPGRSCRLHLGDHDIVLPPDPVTQLAAFDPSPAFLAVASGLHLAVLSPSIELAPLWVGAPGGLASVALAVALALALAPFPIDLAELVASLGWPAASVWAIGSTEEILRAQSEVLAEAMADHEAAGLRDAYDEGRLAVLSLVAEVRFRLWRLYHQHPDDQYPGRGLGNGVLVEAGRRLREVDRRLEDLRWPDGS